MAKVPKSRKRANPERDEYGRAIVVLPVPKKRKGVESKLVKACLEYLGYAGVYAFRVNNGAVYDPSRKRFRSMSGTPGVADIIGVRNGQFLAVEAKTAKGTQSADQKIFQAAVEAAGGQYILARSLDDLSDRLTF